MAAGTGLKRLLSSTALPYLDQYQELTDIAHKGHKAIFHSLFEDLCQSDTFEEPISSPVKIAVVLKTAQLISASYLKVFKAKTDRFYGVEGVVRKMLADDPNCYDGVPISALAAEGQVSELKVF